MQRILVAGAGMTGLSAGYHLQKRVRAANLDAEVVVVERDPFLGGKTQTEMMEGMVVEAGPDSFVTTKPWMLELCRDLGLPVTGTNPKCTTTYIYHNGQFEQLPVGMQLMIPTQVMPFVTTRLISVLGKLRAGLEPFIPIKKGEEDESIGHFVRRRFGQEVLENIAGPLMGGIYGGDFDSVSLKATFPMFMKMEQEQGSLLLAAQRQKRAGAAKPKGPTGFSTFMTVPTGLKSAVDAVVQASDGVRYLTGTGLAGLKPNGSGYSVTLTTGEELQVDAVVMAVPAHAAAPLVEPFLPEVAGRLKEIQYGNSLVVALGYNRSEVNHPLDASGFLVPNSEPLDVAASTWVSSKWSHAAPPDKALIRVFLGRAGGKDWTKEPDEVILAAVLRDLEKIMGLTAKPIATRFFRWPRSMAQYRVGHLDRVDKLDTLTLKQSPGLYLAGAAYRGFGLPDCVREGRTAAERVAKHLNWPEAAEK